MEMTYLDLVSRIMGLRGKSFRLSRKEDILADEIHSVILYRSEVDKEIDRLEDKLLAIRKRHTPEPTGVWGWMK